MANMNVNPTRMELMRLKTRLKTTIRGHKLLKDRADEMVRQFVRLIYENKELRERLEGEIITALRSFSLAQAQMTKQEVELALAMPCVEAEIEAGYDAVMGIDVPKLSLKDDENDKLFPYSFTATVSGMDVGIATMRNTVGELVRLAEVEKTCDILAVEIEKIRRRVNALEQFTIPQIRREMKRIVMKLDENERSNLVRLMKVKELITEE